MEHFAITHFHSVLVVDDDPVCREYTSQALRQAGKSVKEAAGLGDALRLALECLPELILTDLHLADGDGATLVRRVRSAWPSSHPPPACVAMTAAEPARCRATLAHGAFSGVLRKPFRPSELTGVAEDVSRRRTHAASKPAKDEPSALQRSAVDELAGGIDRVDRLLQQHRLYEAAALAHRLAGTAAVCGLAKLGRRLRSLCAACETGSPGEMADAFVTARRAAAGLVDATGRSG